MSDQNALSPGFKYLAGYYGTLQTVHLLLLARAGLYLLSAGTVPFPALPPANGWSAQVIPFLLGMGALDGAAAGLGIFSAISLFGKKHFDYRFWILELSPGSLYPSGDILLSPPSVTLQNIPDNWE